MTKAAAIDRVHRQTRVDRLITRDALMRRYDSMLNRRDLLKSGAAVLLAGASRGVRAQGPKPRRILMLGGTGFIGPHIVHAALARGHQVSMLNRGQREPNQNAGDFAKVGPGRKSDFVQYLDVRDITEWMVS
jgi:2'-hydroxyisoflavone reductase